MQYTAPAYVARTSRPCHPLSFAELANGHLTPLVMSPGPLEPVWDIVICSFALHLIPTQSELFALLHELSGKARWLAVISPHKKPEVGQATGERLTRRSRRPGVGRGGTCRVGKRRGIRFTRDLRDLKKSKSWNWKSLKTSE